jgi:hypothetical protein
LTRNPSYGIPVIMITTLGPIDLDKAGYGVSYAAALAGLEAPTARLWIRKKWLRSRGDKAAAANGLPAMLTGRTVIEMVIAARLRSMGILPQLACKAARSFTEVSDPLEGFGRDRYPGELFEDCLTLLVVYEDGDSVVLPAAKDIPITAICSPPGAMGMKGSRREVAVVLLLNDLLKPVLQALLETEALR